MHTFCIAKTFSAIYKSYRKRQGNLKHNSNFAQLFMGSAHSHFNWQTKASLAKKETDAACPRAISSAVLKIVQVEKKVKLLNVNGSQWRALLCACRVMRSFGRLQMGIKLQFVKIL